MRTVAVAECGIFPDQESSEPVSPALAGGFLSTVPLSEVLGGTVKSFSYWKHSMVVRFWANHFQTTSGHHVGDQEAGTVGTPGPLGNGTKLETTIVYGCLITYSP